MKQTNIKQNKLAVFQTKTGAIELRPDSANETIWASLDQIAEIFNRDKSVISRHIRNVFQDRELSRRSVVAFFATTASDGKTYQIEYFNLDLVLSVGYRVSGTKATKFRQWATNVLRHHITQGYSINPARISAHYAEFLKAVDDIKALVPANSAVDASSVLELVRAFADTWMSLDAYDKDELATKGSTKKTVALTADELQAALAEFKSALAAKGQATDLFGQERVRDGIGGIVGSVMQSFGGKPVYPTVEEKAAHLLYFVVKNHVFADGNKRSAAFAFVWFLRRAKRLDPTRMSPEALTALTLLIAESDPRDKGKLIGLACRLLSKKSS